MIRILLITLLIAGCGGGGSEPKPIVISPPPLVVIPDFLETYPDFLHRTDYYGIFTQLNDNSWDFLSHTVDNPECERSLYHACKKVGVHYFYEGSHTPGRERKTTYNFTVTKWNSDDPSYHVIFDQNWFRSDPLDENGWHPVTTLKLKPWRGVSIVAYNNSWQWDYTVDNPYDSEDPQDKLHRHPEDEWTAQKQIVVGQTYHIEKIMIDGVGLKDGEVIIYIDGELFSHAYYQTKPVVPVTTNLDWLGTYTYRDYNPRVNACIEITGQPEQVCKAIGVKFENYQVFERNILQ